jgi:hypothetical protein
MHREDNKDGTQVTRRAMVTAAEALIGAKDRAITPPDGLVSRSGGHVSVFCATCQRWIDCYVEIAPETAHERHRALLH